jgi:hypothetical protein
MSDTPRTDRETYTIMARDIGFTAISPNLGKLLERELAATLKAKEDAQRDAGAKQAEIDRLMLEFCPDEMTEQQLANWAAHQKPVSDDEAAAIDAALKDYND